MTPADLRLEDAAADRIAALSAEISALLEARAAYRLESVIALLSLAYADLALMRRDAPCDEARACVEVIVTWFAQALGDLQEPSTLDDLPPVMH